MSEASQRKRITIGRVSGVHGVKGWVKLFSYTQPRENILSYQHVELKVGSGKSAKWQPMVIDKGQPQGKGIIAHFAGIDDRDEALSLRNADIAVYRDQFEPTQENEYYWSDLIGLQVINQEGVNLGQVKRLMETGANDVLVVQDDEGVERLIPWVLEQVVLSVDLSDGTLSVDWGADF